MDIYIDMYIYTSLNISPFSYGFSLTKYSVGSVVLQNLELLDYFAKVILRSDVAGRATENGISGT